jgi:hypothetical protein
VKPKVSAPAGGANRFAKPPTAPKVKADAVAPAAGQPAPKGQTP